MYLRFTLFFTMSAIADKTSSHRPLCSRSEVKGSTIASHVLHFWDMSLPYWYWWLFEHWDRTHNMTQLTSKPFRRSTSLRRDKLTWSYFFSNSKLQKGSSQFLTFNSCMTELMIRPNPHQSLFWEAPLFGQTKLTWSYSFSKSDLHKNSSQFSCL
jgi:hypothetical protein